MICIDNKALVDVTPAAAAGKVIMPEEVAEDVYECYEEGAIMVHLHVRDKEGYLTPDMSLLEETLTMIRRNLDIIIEVSMSGVPDLNIQERCAPLYSEVVEAYSLNVKSTSLGRGVYCNPIGSVEYCIREILGQKKTSEVETFKIGHTWTMEQLMKRYDFTGPVLFDIILSHEGEAPVAPQALAAMIQMTPSNAMWGITRAHRKDFSLLANAVGMGAKTVRIGFENSNYLDPQTQVTSNIPLMEGTMKPLRIMDKEPMQPEEARALLGIGR